MSKGVQGDHDVAIEDRVKAKKPSLYKVLLHNDDYTTMEFVVWLLMTVFHHDTTSAQRIMMHVHQNGDGRRGRVSRARSPRPRWLRRSSISPERTSSRSKCTMEPE
jgi:ATP-dependent Clp protease adaptor protein ClpS